MGREPFADGAEPLRLGRYRLDRLRGELMLPDGSPAPLRRQALEVLLALAEHAGHVVDKDTLMRRVWPGKVVTDDSLVQAVADIRRLLGADADAYLRTVPRRGYLLLSAAPAARTAAPGQALFGRDADVAELRARLERHVLVTLVGPPGVGKTRLAREVIQAPSSRPWPDGEVLVDLATIREPAEVGNAIRHALEIDSLDPGANGSTWAAALGDRRVLMLLDNCEHVLDAVAATVQQMLAHAPHLRVLATSQLPLRLPAESCLRLAPLQVLQRDDDLAQAELCPAVALLEARVRALDPTFRLDDAPALAAALDICRQLDGLPLAIELAAVRVPLLGLQGVRDRLAERFRLLRADRARNSLRHHTLQDAFDWSHGLLAAPEQRLLRRLGVFNGGFSLDMAQAVAGDADGDDWQVLDGLGSLVEKSLAVLGTGEPPRFRLLDSARAFAVDRLREAGELEALSQRHAGAVLSTVMAANQERKEGRTPMDVTLSRVRAELPQVRSAMAWALASPGDDSPTAVAMAAAAWPSMLFLGLHTECLRWMLALEERLDERTPPQVAGFFLMGLGKLALRADVPPPRRHAALQRAEALFRSLGETEFHLGALQVLAQSACQQGDTAAALASMREARSLIGPEHAAAYHADLAIWQAMACALEGRTGEARSAYEQALACCRAEGDEEFLFLVLGELAELELLLGLADVAAQRLQSLVEAARARRLHSHVLGPLLVNLCGALAAQALPAAAQQAGAEALRHMRLIGCARVGCHFHAWVAAQQGRHTDAARLVGAGDALRRKLGEVRALNEPRARASAWTLLTSALAASEAEIWRLEGETLDDAELGKLILRAP